MLCCFSYLLHPVCLHLRTTSQFSSICCHNPGTSHWSLPPDRCRLALCPHFPASSVSPSVYSLLSSHGTCCKMQSRPHHACAVVSSLIQNGAKNPSLAYQTLTDLVLLASTDSSPASSTHLLCSWPPRTHHALFCLRTFPHAVPFVTSRLCLSAISHNLLPHYLSMLVKFPS